MATNPVQMTIKDEKSFQEFLQENRRHSEGDSVLSKLKCESKPPNSVLKQSNLQRSHTISYPVDFNCEANGLQHTVGANVQHCYCKQSADDSTRLAGYPSLCAHCCGANSPEMATRTAMTADQLLMAESDMVVDNLVRELNQKNRSSSSHDSTPFHSFSSSLDDHNSSHMFNSDSIGVTPMQTSPTSQLLNNLEDFVDLSFLDADKLPTDDLLASVSNPLSSPAEFVSSHEAQPNGNSSYSLQNSITDHAHIAHITDYCPEWAPSTGGCKVLVTGPWYAANSTYAVLFDGMAVSAERIQSGVLRCYAPAHTPGEVTLHVACDGCVISDSVSFQFRVKDETLSANNLDKSHEIWSCLTEATLKTMLAKRLIETETRLAPVPFSYLQKTLDVCLRESDLLETQFIEFIQQFTQRSWVRGNVPLHSSDRLTLLHLAAALGYARLIQALLGWKAKKPSLLLDYEVDALTLDSNCCTPLMWACRLGHFEAAKELYKWRPSALSVADKDGKLPLHIATEKGYSHLAGALSQLEQLQHEMARSQSVFSSVSRETTPSSQTVTLQNPGTHQRGLDDLAQKCMFALSPEKSSPGLLSNLSADSGQTSFNFVDMGQSSSLHNSEERWFTPPKSPLAKTACDLRGNSSAHNSMSLSLASSLGDEHLFKVPNPPLHSTPKSAQALFVNIPTPQCTHDTLPTDKITLSVTPRSRKSHDKSRDSTSRRNKLLKRISVEVLPDYPGSDPMRPCSASDLGIRDHLDLHQVRARSLTLDEMNDPHSMADYGLNDLHPFTNDPMISMNSRDLNSPIMFLPEVDCVGLTLRDIRHQHTDMETESSSSSRCTSGSERYMDEKLESASQDQNQDGNQANQMATLANQIIAAMPERIKLSPSRCDDVPPEEFSVRRDRSSSYDSFSSATSNTEPQPAPPCSVTEDSGISAPLEGIAFEDYRYPDLSTPTSSLSPASSLHSPYVDHFSLDSPPPTTAEFNEYFNAPQTFMEKDFSQLTLSDAEQRKLYEAAKIIQSFYRRYKDRQEHQMKQRQKELEAVVLIQTCYRRYKQYIYTKKMTQAAVLIQSQFRSYYAQKRFKKSRQAARLIQNRYRAYKEQERYKKRKDAAVLIQQRFRNHYQRKRGTKATGQNKCAEGERSQPASSRSRSEDAGSETHARADALQGER